MFGGVRTQNTDYLHPVHIGWPPLCTFRERLTTQMTNTRKEICLILFQYSMFISFHFSVVWLSCFNFCFSKPTALFWIVYLFGWRAVTQQLMQQGFSTVQQIHIIVFYSLYCQESGAQCRNPSVHKARKLITYCAGFSQFSLIAPFLLLK